MIKRQLFWWVILAILIIVGLSFLGDEHGHVMIVRHPYRVQLSFNLLLVIIALSFLVFYYLMRLFGVVRRMPDKWQTKKSIKKLSQQQALLVEGAQALIDEDADKAKKLLQKANKQSEGESITQLIEALEQKTNPPKQITQVDSD